MATVLAAGDDPIKRVNESLPSMEGFVYMSLKRKALSRPREKHFVRLIHGKLYYYFEPERHCEWSMAVRDTTVGRGVGRHSVQVSSLKRTVTFYTKTSEEQKRWLLALQRCARWKLHDFYELGDIVGNVNTSRVQTCVHLKTGAELAVKTVTRADRPPDLVYNEMAIISQPLHANIIHAVDILESADNVYLVQEYMHGGSLYDFIKTSRKFTEPQARMAMRAMLNGVKVLHENDIVHRDLKPENILVDSLSWPIKLKIADFGLAGFVTKNGYLKQVQHFIGTVGYAAPEQYEVPAKKCGRPVDMWACGAVLFNMLTATMPFPGDSREEIIIKSKRGNFSFQGEEWNGVSVEAKDFISRCFEASIMRRMTVDEALEHEWIIAEEPSEESEKSEGSVVVEGSENIEEIEASEHIENNEKSENASSDSVSESNSAQESEQEKEEHEDELKSPEGQ